MTTVEAKHAFISYVKEDSERVDGLCKVLDAANIPYWRDRKDLAPGVNWKAEIRKAIRSGALVFIACFSENSRTRHKSVMNEELTLAVEEFRLMAPGATWLVPVRFDDGPIPEWDLGAGRSLGDLQYASLFGEQYTTEAVKLTANVSQAMGINSPDPATTRAAVEEAKDSDRPALLCRLTKDMILDPARKIELDDLLAQETRTILVAMRDENRFPTRNYEGSTDGERIAQMAALVADYWRLVEPFCWSLQVAARFAPDATALAPWTRTLRSICAESIEPKGGVTALLDLRAVPTMIATFSAGLACIGQARWDNLKTLVVDTTVTDKQRQRKIPLIEATYPWLPFRHVDIVPHVVARSVLHHEDPQLALAAFNEGKVGRYHTPVAEWLRYILRAVFNDQFPDEDTYTSEFELAEVIMGIVSQDQAFQLAGDDQNRRVWARSSWFGRSAWRSRRGYGNNLVNEVDQELTADSTAWPPLKAGLFGGDAERAAAAIRAYSEDFFKAGSQYL